VEVQEQAKKAGINDFGSWIYKMQTLQAKTLVAVSEAGFTTPVMRHVEQLHTKTVKLVRIFTKWMMASSLS